MGIKDDPIEYYYPPQPAAAVPHPLPEGIAGVKRMLDVSTDIQEQAMVACCGLVGMRITEALTLKAENFDFTEDFVKIHGKGNKHRRVPLSPLAITYIKPAYCQAVLEGLEEVIPFGDRTARECITSLAKEAKLQRAVSSHDLRATFATAVYKRCKDPVVVQRLLGHASVATTLIYIGTAWEEMMHGVEI